MFHETGELFYHEKSMVYEQPYNFYRAPKRICKQQIIRACSCTCRIRISLVATFPFRRASVKIAFEKNRVISRPLSTSREAA